MFTNVGCVTIFVHYIHFAHTNTTLRMNSDGKMVCGKYASLLNGCSVFDAFDVNRTGYIWRV